MKKILFWTTQAIMLLLCMVWIICVLHYYQVVDMNINWLPQLDYSILNGPKENLISNVVGFATVKQIGYTCLIIGFGIFNIYVIAMAFMYYFNQVSKNVIFWLNIVFFSFFLISFLIGILFINLPL